MIQRINGFILQSLHNIKLKYKLLISHFIVIVVLMSVFTVISYNRFSEVIYNNIMYAARQSYDQTLSFITYKLDKLENVSNVVSFGSNINRILTNDITENDTISLIKDYRELISLLSSFEDKSEIVNVRLYINPQLPYSEENVNLYSIDSARNEEWFRRLNLQGGKILFCPSRYLGMQNGKTILSIAREVRNLDNLNQILGYSRVDMYEENIRSIIRKANATDNSLTYICNSDNVIVSTSSSMLLEKYKIDLSVVKKLSAGKDSFKELQVGSERLLVNSSLFPGTDWYMVNVTPLDEILSKANVLKSQMLILVTVMLLVAYVLAFYISTSITKRISLLNKKMREVQRGNLEKVPDITGKDEVSELTGNFNYMLGRIELLVEEQYKAGREIKTAELKALQSQINPHFLYNTLEMINWLAKKGRIGDVEVATHSLASFYKSSLNKGKDITTLKDELVHVTAYLKIQNIRFKDAITLTVNIPDELLDYGIPKIILQPIVENSIIHGILPRDEQKGQIIIVARSDEQGLIITVEDDGIGMDQDSLTKLKTGDLKSKTGSSYGIFNITERVRLTYGEKYGITYKSTPGEGTRVQIRLPAIKVEELKINI